ncbi:MAG: preprotein translocase subunit SecE [Minisyncoccia bacterium]
MKLIDYLRETKGELKHVSWPTKKQAVIFTVLVIIISVVTSLILSGFDFGFSYIPKYLININN